MYLHKHANDVIIFSLLMALRLCELKYYVVTLKMNVIYFGVDAISTLFMRHQSKTRNRCAKISLFSPLSNSVFVRRSYFLRMMGFFLRKF